MATYSAAAERNKNAQLATGYNDVARSLFADELSTVGNYEIGEMIGKGSFGKVYLAHHIMTKTKVVVKAADKFETEGLAREIYHHRRLRHPHITRLYEVVHTEKNVWLVLEYCHGGELFDFLLKRNRLKEPVVQKMFAQLVGALAYIHKSGCVHRDLKLENILLDKNENVKLVDFGFTRQYDPRKLLETWCGTYSYSAPEILRGEKYSGEAVDVWSLGVILYSLLTGELPFDGEDEMATKLRVTKREYKIPDDISANASSLISSILSEPEGRPTLAKILAHPFLANHAPKQVHILAHNMLVPFSTPIEKRLLDRFEKANIDTHRIMQQVSEGGTGPLVGLWELSLEKAHRHEEYKKKKKRRRSHDISIISTTEYMVDEEIAVSPRAMTPVDPTFAEREFAVAPFQEDTRPKSRASRASTSRAERCERLASYSRSQSPTKYTYRWPMSPKKVREKQSKGIFHALRNLISDWSRQGQKLTHKKSKGALVSETANNAMGGKDVKNHLELKKSKSGDSASKDEQRRNRKGVPPSISIIPPQVHSRKEGRSPTAETESPLSGGYESEGNGDSPIPRHKRPSYHRRRSTSSSITSLHSRHRYSHSKTSSTSSMESGSVSTPRHSKGNLKIVPATPPPHLLTHEGAKNFSSAWGEGVVIARRRRSPFRGPPVGFMSSLGKNRKGQPKQNGKWPEGAIQEEDEDGFDEDAIDEGDLDELGGRGSYDISELGGLRRGSDADQRSISASV